MIYNKCPLFKMQSKKRLFSLLKTNNSKVFLKQDKLAEKTKPFIDYPKPRLIEPSYFQSLKQAQTIIKNSLQKIEVPEYLFSGIKGKSYASNAKYHAGVVYSFQTDIKAFFPNTKRDKVYCFFRDELQTSPDVAEILTNITTIDIDRTICNKEPIYEFIRKKNIKTNNHLISGAPSSTILAYFANHKMFDEIYNYDRKNGVKMSVYVDDIFFSSRHKISARFKNTIISIIRKHGHQVSLNKTVRKRKNQAKCITGAIITANGDVAIKNSLRKKVMVALTEYKKNPSIDNKRVLLGCISAARQVDGNSYPSIRKLCESEQ